ncbi:hypothetical protein EPA93_47810 [Ktedonosporobacter rubrisoli]|uniref:Transcription regulator PadR C-terminal domain-containing protein n=1 Tax=Ktedonosporobacter rubrisoli TaxID=2509675 RepID=A0A4P6K598_KTERU|nr:hypothetical protein [Ktedonosporobacter rubrisoli]QBD83265.1 hypothetical protein EPA93_47810 [Ktedonosporobacter rubrisoli]
MSTQPDHVPQHQLLKLWQELACSHQLYELNLREAPSILDGWCQQLRSLYAQVLIERQRLPPDHCPIQLLILDHLQTLLEAEIGWLDHALLLLNSRQLQQERTGVARDNSLDNKDA